MKKKTLVTNILLGVFSAVTSFGQSVPYSAGRIALSSDGNMHDNDDWGATSASLGILASQGLQDKVVLYTYSDHVWGSEDDDRAEMIESAVTCGNKFGFDTSNFMAAVDDPGAAYNAMRDVILASSASDPLTIVVAGPMEVCGRGLNKAKNVDSSTLQYVRVISHSGWNENHADSPASNEDAHSGWTWAEMKDAFSDFGVNFDEIRDQNQNSSITEGFASHKAGPGGSEYWDVWHFIRDYNKHSASINSAIQFIYARMEASGKCDISDCGMVYYMVTGDEQGNPEKLEAMFDDGFAAAEITGTFYIENKFSGNRIRPFDGVEGAPVVQCPNTWGGKWTRWERLPTSNGYFYLRNKANGQYLYMPDAANGSAVKATFVAGEEAEWKTIAKSGEYVLIENRSYGKHFRISHAENMSANPEGNINVKVGDPTWNGDKAQFVLESR
ncbi:RICIN domain-containing protein [Pontiella agarivorans]|uniref:RICIN domain-containing protein n=1 Tax=Pontiella agarivorans TaxID=3038953 RepID=A0ABU5MYA0_9BACT|nr:RICIN domain-containing protein [Pontiella agarivorans]MDZ8119145.1 RICIN domain-containing protein [Pontiella agarivorans]